jgi:hypothetical protein
LSKKILQAGNAIGLKENLKESRIDPNEENILKRPGRAWPGRELKMVKAKAAESQKVCGPVISSHRRLLDANARNRKTGGRHGAPTGPAFLASLLADIELAPPAATQFLRFKALCRAWPHRPPRRAIALFGGTSCSGR